ncbi:MAG: ribonuclease III [Hyphomonadaceae bacterium]|nr:ribonuclease III [Clostridia bacterium]
MDEQFFEAIGYTFHKNDDWQKALQHSSYVNEQRMDKLQSNERLEFLGDAVLSITVSRYIYEQFPSLPEGELTRVRASVVCEQALAECARKIALGNFLLMGKGEHASGGRERESILADAFEAVIAVIYLDSDLKTVGEWVLGNLSERIHIAVKGKAFIDYKTTLQEILQAKGKPTPQYTVANESGPDHQKTFVVEIRTNDASYQGTGNSKKEAEQAAAKTAMQGMGEA